MPPIGPKEGQPFPSPNSGNSDKRYLPRWIVNNRVLYQKENEDFYRECRSKDIHCEGACIKPEEVLTPDQKLKLAIYLNDEVAVHVQGKVLWALSNTQQYFAGLQFFNISEKVQDMILQYAFKLNKTALTNHWFQGW